MRPSPHGGSGGSPTGGPHPRVSFVIPVRDDAARLAKCLSSIRENEYAGELEIVVADNGSTDGSPDVARAAGATVLSLPGLSVAELRNRGSSASTGEILAFVDSDHEISSQWASAAVASLSETTVGAVGALCHAPSDGTWVQRTYDLLRPHPRGVQQVPWLGSGNLAVRRRAFEEVGGFDARLVTCEDIALCQRLRRAGYRILSNESLHSVHFGDPRGLGELFRGELWRGRDNVRVSLRMIGSIREIPSLVVPVLDLSLMCAAPVALVAGGPAGPLLASTLLACVLALSAARVRTMSQRMKRGTFLGLARAFAVALVYDVARALALVTRARHRRGALRVELPGEVPNRAA